jgi:hypothetical protein
MWFEEKRRQEEENETSCISPKTTLKASSVEDF